MLIIVSSAIVVLMLIQHWLIMRKKETSDDWEKILQRYRLQLRLTIAITIAASVPGTALLLSDYVSHQGLGFQEPLRNAIAEHGLPIPLFVTFFSSALRLFVERTVENSHNLFRNAKELFQSFITPKRLRAISATEDITNTVINPRGDTWFLVLIVSLFVTLVQQILLELGVYRIVYPDSSLAIFLIATFSLLLISIGYPCWIYMTIYIKLTEAHHFSSRATRLFLGALFTNEIPNQVVLIGPPHSGKTTFRLKTPSDTPSFATDVSTTVLMDENDNTLTLTLIDPPGENMGDHLILTTVFRADSLVFVLDLQWLSVESLGDPTNYSLPNWHNLIGGPTNTEEAVKKARTYMNGFQFATHRDGNLLQIEDLFRVRSFVLYLNQKAPDKDVSEILAALDTERLQTLSEHIGERFGVEPEHCCCIVGNAVHAGKAIDLLAFPTSVRASRAAAEAPS